MSSSDDDGDDGGDGLAIGGSRDAGGDNVDWEGIQEDEE